MSDGDLDIKLYGDASHVIKEQAKLIKQQEQAIETYKKLATESKKSGKEAEKAAKDAEKANAAAAKELDRFARATKDINRTPLEKYADEMLRLNRALKAGKIDQETFNRAVARSKIEMQQAGIASNEAFGSSMTSKLGAYVQGMAGLAGATSLFSSALAQANADVMETLSGYEALIEQRRNLLQIADPGGQDKQTAEADSLAMTYGLTRKDAYELLTSSKNEGFESSVPFIARTIAANIATQQSASTVAGQIPALFPGAGLTPEKAMNMNLAAAGSSRLSFEGIAAGLPIAAETMSLAGSSPAETMGVLGVLSKRFRSGETAGMRASMLAGKLSNDPRFEGKGLMGGVDMLAAMSDEERRGFLKDDKETNAAYKVILQERASIMQRITEAEKAGSMAYGDDSLVSIAEKQAFDPSTREGRNWSAYIENNKSIARRQVEAEGRAAEYYSAETAVNDQRTSMEARGVNMFSRYISRAAMAIAKDYRLSPEIVSAAGAGGEAFLPGAFKQAITVTDPSGGGAMMAYEGVTSLLGRLTSASDKLDSAAANLESATSNVARQRDAAATVPE